MGFPQKPQGERMISSGGIAHYHLADFQGCQVAYFHGPGGVVPISGTVTDPMMG
jgi:hypothetical protein